MKRFLLRYVPSWIALALLIIFVLPTALAATLNATGRIINRLPYFTGVDRLGVSSAIAPLFTPEVKYWSEDINRWALQYNLDPNLLATVMQIESCGNDTISSSVGAQGLFQVMPFHFAAGENQLDPDTNALRSTNFLNLCLNYADGDAGLALACYNGGPGVVGDPPALWPDETQRYYQWGTTIYADAQLNKNTSEALQAWLDAGGVILCRQADAALGISS